MIDKNTFENTISYMIFGSLAVLALSLFMSISILAISHALIIIPIIYFLNEIEWKKIKVHNWALLIFSLLIPISIVYAKNMEHSLGLYNIMKFKYFTIGALASFPITWWLNKKATLKQIQFLFKAVLISSSLASISGMIGWLTGFNPLKWAPPTINYQNAGMFSISLTYSHNEAVFCILLIGILLNYNEFKEYVSKKLLIACFIINLIGFYTSYSRGAFIAFLVVLPFFFFKKNLKKFVIAIITSSIFFYLAYYYFPHFKTVFSGRQHSSGLRYGLWMAALKLFELNPIMGVGFRNFQPWSTFIKSQYGYFEPLWEGHAHNNYLEILAGMGLVGIIPFIIWIFGWLIDSFKRDDLLGKIFFPTILMIILGGLTQNTITDGVNLFFFMALYSFYNSKYKPNI